MRFIELAARLGPWALVLGLLASCSSRVPPASPPPAPASPGPAPVVTPPSGSGAAPAAGPAAAAAAAAANAGRLPLPPPRLPAARSMEDLRLAFAKRLVEANPTSTYMSEVIQPLLAIPVLEVELRADGSVAAVKVLRPPSQAKDTVQLAIEAVYRAAPFGDISRVPKPWKFTEVFLFNEERKFKPRMLDQ